MRPNSNHESDECATHTPQTAGYRKSTTFRRINLKEKLLPSVNQHLNIIRNVFQTTKKNVLYKTVTYVYMYTMQPHQNNYTI